MNDAEKANKELDKMKEGFYSWAAFAERKFQCKRNSDQVILDYLTDRVVSLSDILDSFIVHDAITEIINGTNKLHKLLGGVK